MDARLLDASVALLCFAVLVSLVILLPAVLAHGTAYLLALVVFVLAMSGAGILVNRAIA